MEWKSSIEELDEVTKQLKVAISSEQYGKEYDSAVKRFMGEVKIKGFRPGKVPRQVVEKMYGAKIRSEVVQQLVSSSLGELLKEHKINAIGWPEITLDDNGSEEFNYTANVPIMPTPEISGYDHFEVTVEKKEVVGKDVDEAIENLRKSKATAKPLQDRVTAQSGDVVEAEFIIMENGVQGEGRPEPATVVLGDGRLPDGLEAGMIGMSVGEAKVISHSELGLDGSKTNESTSKLSYQVTLKSISERVLPEVDDAFASSLGYGVETLLELRVKLSENIENSRQQQAKQEAQVKILEQLGEKNSFKVPQVMVDDEIREILVKERMIDPEKQDPSRISMEPFRQHFNDIAIKRVNVRVIVDRVAQQEQIEVKEDDLEKSYQELAEAYNVPIESARQYFSEKGRLENFEDELRRGKVLDFLMTKADIKYVDEMPASDSKKD